MNYNIEHQVLLKYTEQKVATLFAENSAPAHEFDHSERVANWIRIIAKQENARNPFLCELSALLHDIGRTREHVEHTTLRHHELSYQMLQEWFRTDRAFDTLRDDEKIEVLYAVRYHWNNAADDYDTAWILRDADKLDSMGNVGLQRSKDYCGDDRVKFELDLRFRYDMYYWVRTDTAKRLIEEHNLMKIVDDFYLQYLKEKITDIEL